MLENYLYYDGVDTRFATNGYQFFLQNEAPELSFDFNQIIYDPDSGQYQLLTNDSTELVEMNELQKAEIQDYLEYYMDEHDFIVHAYAEPYNLFEGSMYKSTAEEQNFSYRINEMPTGKCPKWNDEHQRWENCDLVILSDGTPIYYPESFCTECVKGFTAEEMELIGDRPSPYHKWDLVNDVWYDGRTLERAKMDACISIRADFEVYRQESTQYKYYVPEYENITWSYQLNEARHWLQDNTWETPYIDAFLENRIDNEVPTKEEFCNEVIQNNKNFLTTIGKVNAEEWYYLVQVKNATTNEECIEITNNAKNYCYEKRIGTQDVL